MNKSPVVITGVASGIGAQCYKLLSSTETFEPFGIDLAKSDFTDLRIDLGEEAELKRAAAVLRERFDDVAGLVNCAALHRKKKLEELSFQTWVEILRVNTVAPFYLLGLIQEQIREGGAVVNISSVHSHSTTEGMAAYAASKGAMISATKAAALELAERNITVNCISPGAVNTPMLQAGLRISSLSEEDQSISALAQNIPLKCVAEPSQIAKAVEFLLSSSELGITGTELVIDGGVLASLASERPH